MSNAPSIVVTWCLKSAGTFRENADGSFKRIWDAPATFTGPVTLGAQPAKQAAEGAPKGNSGERGAGGSSVRPSLSQPKTGPEPLATAALLPWHPPKEPPPVKTAPPRQAPPKATQSPPDPQGSLFG